MTVRLPPRSGRLGQQRRMRVIERRAVLAGVAAVLGLDGKRLAGADVTVSGVPNVDLTYPR